MFKTRAQIAARVKQLRQAVLNASTHYETLGVSVTANYDEIKRAHRMLALYFHPDRSAFTDAHDLMSKVNQAYSCLEDTAARAKYDLLNKIASEPCPKCEGLGTVGKSKGKGFTAKKIRVDCTNCGGSGRVAQSK